MDKKIKLNTVCVYFSKDRAMQLDLSLRSKDSYCKDSIPHDTFVLYTYSDEKYEDGYNKLKDKYKNIFFIKETDFKEDLIKIISGYEFVLFCVDDTVFTNYFSLQEIITLLDNSTHSQNLVGFSLRLGLNTINCYPTGKLNYLPVKAQQSGNIFIYDWVCTGEGDFSYPLELSSSIYKLRNIYNIIAHTNYINPNELEWNMYLKTKLVTIYSKNLLGLYTVSVAFSNPLNKVQNTNNNKFGNIEEYSQSNLNNKFLNNYIIDFNPFKGFVSNGCHQDVGIQYVKEKK